ncbi:hypothetical protein ACHAXR_001054, partial [Thalassiosira sp. AJA248-18]
MACHNRVRDGTAPIVKEVLKTAGFIGSSSRMEIEPRRVVEDLPGLRPFDFAFRPVPSFKYTHIPPCPFTQIGVDVTITSPKGHVPPSRSGAASNNLSAKAAKHLVDKERGKLMRDGKLDTISNCYLTGEQIIEILYRTNRVLIPMAVSPYGRWGPMFHHFLFGSMPGNPQYKFPATRPAAARMFDRLQSHPSPNNIVGHATKQWKENKPQQQIFYGHSHTAPTPKEYTLQKLGLVISNAIALHVRDAQLGALVAPTDPYDEDFTPTQNPPATATVPTPVDGEMAPLPPLVPPTAGFALAVDMTRPLPDLPAHAPTHNIPFDTAPAVTNPLIGFDQLPLPLLATQPLIFGRDFADASDLWMAPPWMPTTR